jgi:hypothetical protein
LLLDVEWDVLEADTVADFETVDVVAHDTRRLVIVDETGVPPRGITLDEKLEFAQHLVVRDGCVPVGFAASHHTCF